HQSPQNVEAADVWQCTPRSPGAPLPAGTTGAGSPGRRATGAGPGPSHRAGRVVHPYYQRGHHLHACALAVAARPARERAVQRHTGVAACRLSHACDLPTGWTSAAYDISLSTITKSGHEPTFCANRGPRQPTFVANEPTFGLLATFGDGFKRYVIYRAYLDT